MDGYARARGRCRHACRPSCASSANPMPAARSTGTIGAGEAARIFTGASVPNGADAVVIQEDTDAQRRHAHRARGGYDRRQHPPAGGDFRQGDTLLRAGRLLDASAITLAAAGGHAKLKVRRAPRIAILATGDELVEPGTKPGRRPDRVLEPLWPRRADQALRRRAAAARHRRRHARSAGSQAGDGRRCRRAGDHRRGVGRRSRPRQAGAGSARA